MYYDRGSSPPYVAAVHGRRLCKNRSEVCLPKISFCSNFTVGANVGANARASRSTASVILQRLSPLPRVVFLT